MKILYLTSRVPSPLDRGDKLRAFHQIRHLSRRHEIILCSLDAEGLDPSTTDPLRDLCRRVEVIRLKSSHTMLQTATGLFSRLPLQVNYFLSGKAKRRILALVDETQPDHILCQLIRMGEYVKHLPGPKTLDYMDALSEGLRQRTAWSASWQRPVLRLEHQRVRRYERHLFGCFDNHMIITRKDRDRIDHPETSRIRIVANGVDGKFFHPTHRDKTHHLLFVGNMQYPPNVQAAVWLVEEILPLVRVSIPDCRVMIAGTAPSARVRALRCDRVTVTGRVDDIRRCYDSSRVFLAPMRMGTGLQNKLLEAMAMGLPCITTALARDAFEGNPGALGVATSPATFAQQAVHLLTDETAAMGRAEEGRKLVLSSYRWETVLQELDRIFDA